MVHAQAQTSVGGPATPPPSCSGAMDTGVPTTALVSVPVASSARATFDLPLGSSTRHPVSGTRRPMPHRPSLRTKPKPPKFRL
ncbi:hypothetical protein ACWEN6_39395 [Sphaerisporangium sp. NPDC004334]